METQPATSKPIPGSLIFPSFARPEIPRTLPILARLEDERTRLELALATFRAEIAAGTYEQALTAA